MKIEIAASDGQGAVNEDVVGHYGTAAWVIDGATGVGPGLLDAPSDAAWLASTASDLLRDALAARPRDPTVDILRDVMAGCGNALIRACGGRYVDPVDMPSAAFAMVRIIDDCAEITTLADCRVVAGDHSGGARLFGGSPLDTIEGRTLAKLRLVLQNEPELSPDGVKARLLPLLRDNRRLMNRPQGYWVLGTDPAAADHVWQARVPLAPGQRFAIASDGFLRLTELFNIAEPADLLDIRRHDDWALWLARLRAIERDPNSFARYPRVKLHDDASLIVCRWDGSR